MDLVEFLKNEVQKEKKGSKDHSHDSIEKKKDSERDKLRKEYLNSINYFLRCEIIDMLDYGNLVEFLQTKGSITKIGSFFKSLKKIRFHELDTKDKSKYENFYKASALLFKHLFTPNRKEKNWYKPLSVDNKKITDIIISNKGHFKFTRDQEYGIKKLISFLTDPTEKTYGLYGFAGTGKTTLITETMYFLLRYHYIRSVAFTAPTNKAVNIMKSKFRNDLIELAKIKSKGDIENEKPLDYYLFLLEKKGYVIDFATIHKVLSYQTDFSATGERIFIRGEKPSLTKYDLVIIDECSMLPIQIINHIFEETTKKKCPKILFVGDPAQLPPVNEKISSIFIEKKEDLNTKLLSTVISNDLYDEEGFYKEKDARKIETEKMFNKLSNNILEMENNTLSQIVRTSKNSIISLCNLIRKWVMSKKDVPDRLGKYKEGVKIYRYFVGKKTDTDWFKECLSGFESKNNNIILTWTNNTSDLYNDRIRQNLFGKKKKRKIKRFEVGDILILNDFYNLNETGSKTTDKKDPQRFYTSEQIKIHKIEDITKKTSKFRTTIKKSAKKIPSAIPIGNQYQKTTQYINERTKREYKTWKLFIEKLNGEVEDSYHSIYVIKEKSIKKWEEEKEFASIEIKKLRSYYLKNYKESIATIDMLIIKPLWEEWANIFIDPFANVNYGYSTTVHKSQGSTYYNVYIDMDDILKNKSINEMKRCLYTAITRASNNIYLLV